MTATQVYVDANGKLYADTVAHSVGDSLLPAPAPELVATLTTVPSPSAVVQTSYMTTVTSAAKSQNGTKRAS